MDIERFRKRFAERFGTKNEPEATYYSPGRVNLIGDHTDYNGGYVLPCAINHGIYLIVRKNQHGKIHLASENLEYTAEIPANDISEKKESHWVNYPIGVINQFIQAGHKITGLDFLYYGNIPHGAGLSSSASIETLTAYALNDLTNAGYSITQLALMAHKAETEFVGVQCGIMDQFAVALGKKDHALFLKTDTASYNHVKLDMDDYKIMVVNSNVSRKLSESKYNERVSECGIACEYLSKSRPISNLSQLTFREYVELKHFIPDITIRKRAMHVLSENQRVLDAVDALKKNNLRLFGKLMNASHNSLRHNYEVSCNELDILAETSRQIEGVLGSRMTGAGFGGCIVSLVKKESTEMYRIKVADSYLAKTGLTADFYAFETDNGTRKLK